MKRIPALFQKIRKIAKRIPFIIMLIPTLSAAQDTLWTAHAGGIYTDLAYDMKEVSTGGFILVGKTQSFGAGGEDIYAVRIDGNGSLLWTKTYGGTSNEEARAVIEVSSGGFLILGETVSFGNGSSDYYLIRTDENGDTLWTKTYGGKDLETPRDVIEVSAGGFLLVGGTSSFTSSGSNLWLIRINSNGDVLWEKSLDGGEDDFGMSVKEVSTEGFIVTGHTNRMGGIHYSWVIRLDADGNTIWEKTYLIGSDANDIIACATGGFLLTGCVINSQSPSGDIFAIRIDDNGNEKWTKYFGGDKKDIAYSICEISSGGYVIAGATESFGFGVGDFYLVRIAEDGDTIWTRTYGTNGDDVAYSVVECKTGGLAAGGYASLGTFNSLDVWLVRIRDNSPTIIPQNEEKISQLFCLSQNYPNPFNPTTTINYRLNHEGYVTLKIYDELGREITTLIQKAQPAGSYSVFFNAGNLSSGVYLYRLQVDRLSMTKKMLLLK